MSATCIRCGSPITLNIPQSVSRSDFLCFQCVVAHLVRARDRRAERFREKPWKQAPREVECETVRSEPLPPRA